MFRSFFSAGFEGSTGINRHGEWIDQISATQHDRFLVEDYRRLKALGIHTVRESVRWPLIDQKGKYDFSTFEKLIHVSQREEIEVLYDLFHFGYPVDLDILSEAFLERFEEYCYRVARLVKENSDGPYHFTPVNEPSYYSWAAGEVGLFGPHLTQRGKEVKLQLIRTAIAGINAIWSVIPEAQIINVDPICRTIPVREEHHEHCRYFNECAVFEGWDMLAGRLYPELGGSLQHLGTVGINYYWTNQWLWDSEDRLEEDDPRRIPLGQLVKDVWCRYEVPMIISETSHCNDKRPVWLQELSREIGTIISEGIPLKSVCLYPILGMPEWHDRSVWTCMGFWDLKAQENGMLERVPHTPTIKEFEQLQSEVHFVLMENEVAISSSF